MLWAGLLLLVVGLILRWPTAATVVASAFFIAAGADIGPLQTLDMLGRAFVENRSLTLFLLTLPCLGLCERHGLHGWAGDWIRSVRERRPGLRLLPFYQALRVVQGVLGIRINGHASFVRPLLAPMAEACSPEDPQKVRPHCAAVENLGNFFGQNLNPSQAGPLMVFGLMHGMQIPVSLWKLAAAALAPASLALLLSCWRYRRWP